MDSRINSLIEELADIGYLPHQLNTILEEAIDKGNLENMSQSQIEHVVSYLNEYIAFARKCKSKKI
ncbi:hypothetical protein [Sporomusa aerivorans]|uniref:hypothetical protein n=1 Tax=Sporomusa aerivorans TaxID=204936 RepID=UPI003529FFD0